ncbi:hypothetical protein [Kerstersia gyiorum]|uniref:hypothetical protein n=1 Tax=Kerstersia gyiorum TaxID=206506 RepID=UPI00209F0C41|nr:hypothetical protein [Kerstersia gyiorum]MCP1634652.1 hypothetical protein [Kerstersia gyiorum]MCP1683743.1 hypothetical protein [Kerstersia gyiorum]MCP1719413.1 hypothetical protein [Kerstersia gyiorum]MCW2188227.1 hypothetical protein [Kerstersia gyiorum]
MTGEAVAQFSRTNFISWPAILTRISLTLAVTLAPMAANAQTATPAQPGADSRVSEELGAFRLDSRSGSYLRTISYHGQTYRPLNAVEFIHVQALGPEIGGQPVLLAVSNDLMGVGTILISVQNDTPLARVLSPVIDTRDPDLGLAQPGRKDLLLFIAGSRALDTSTGQVLWFEDRLPGRMEHRSHAWYRLRRTTAAPLCCWTTESASAQRTTGSTPVYRSPRRCKTKPSSQYGTKPT